MLFADEQAVVIALGGEAFFAGITFTSTLGRLIRLLVGSLLIYLGLAQLAVVPGPGFHRIETAAADLFGESSPGRPVNQSYARSARYGFSYVVAGIG